MNRSSSIRIICITLIVFSIVILIVAGMTIKTFLTLILPLCLLNAGLVLFCFDAILKHRDRMIKTPLLTHYYYELRKFKQLAAATGNDFGADIESAIKWYNTVGSSADRLLHYFSSVIEPSKVHSIIAILRLASETSNIFSSNPSVIQQNRQGIIKLVNEL